MYIFVLIPWDSYINTYVNNFLHSFLFHLYFNVHYSIKTKIKFVNSEIKIACANDSIYIILSIVLLLYTPLNVFVIVFLFFSLCLFFLCVSEREN